VYTYKHYKGAPAHAAAGPPAECQQCESAVLTAAANAQPADAAKPGINRPPLTVLWHNGSVASQQAAAEATGTSASSHRICYVLKQKSLLLYAFLVFCTSAKQLARLLTKNNAI